MSLKPSDAIVSFPEMPKGLSTQKAEKLPDCPHDPVPSVDTDEESEIPSERKPRGARTIANVRSSCLQADDYFQENYKGQKFFYNEPSVPLMLQDFLTICDLKNTGTVTAQELDEAGDMLRIGLHNKSNNVGELNYKHAPQCVKNVLEQWDKDKSGSVDLTELIAAGGAYKKLLSQNKVLKFAILGAVLMILILAGTGFGLSLVALDLMKETKSSKDGVLLSAKTDEPVSTGKAQLSVELLDLPMLEFSELRAMEQLLLETEDGSMVSIGVGDVQRTGNQVTVTSPSGSFVTISPKAATLTMRSGEVKKVRTHSADGRRLVGDDNHNQALGSVSSIVDDDKSEEMKEAQTTTSITTSSSKPAEKTVAVLVKQAKLSQKDGGDITLEITRSAGICNPCSAWDWVEINKAGSRVDVKNSHETSSPTFTATLSVPPNAGYGTYGFKYGWQDGDVWKFLDLDFSITLAPADSSNLEVSVEDLALESDDTGSITLGITRGEGLCCSMWDWLGIYKDQDPQRLDYVQSLESTEAHFSGQLQVKEKGSYSFMYSTSVDGWQMHKVGITFSFGAPAKAPPVEMSSLIPSYWWPTDTKWDTLVQAAQTSGFAPERIRVVLNVNNGYNQDIQESVWSLWSDCALKMKNAGFKVFAYVNLCSNVKNFACVSQAEQGDRDFHLVRQEIDKYNEKLGSLVTGFFLDDAGHSGMTTQPVLQVTNYVKNANKEVIHNPGTYSNDEVLLEASTITIMREAHDPGSANPWVMSPGVPASKSSMILHQVGADAWQAHLQTARERGYGHFYATSGSWDSLPSYLVDMFRALQNTP